MKFFRFMGADECCRLCLHHRLLQQVDWQKLGYKSTSKGFTFGIGTGEDAVKASRWLKGVATLQYLLVADVADDVADTMFTHCKGRYPDYGIAFTTDSASHTMYVDEVYTTNYSLEDFNIYNFYICIGLSDDRKVVDVCDIDLSALTSMLLSNSIAERHRDYNTNIAHSEVKQVRGDLTEYQSICEGVKKVMESWNNVADKYSK